MSGLDFTRPDLTTSDYGGVYYEKEVKYINPREFHRKIISDIENLEYYIPRGENERLDITGEVIGSKTGYVLSRIVGTKFPVIVGQITWTPYKFELSIGAVLGILTTIFSKTNVYQFSGIGIFLVCVLLINNFKIRSEFPIELNNTIRVLAEGEATERTFQKGGSHVTDLFAQLTVTFSGTQTIMVNFKKIPDVSLQNELKKIKGVEYPMDITESPLKEFIPRNSLTTFKKEEDALNHTLKKLSKKIETYGTNL